GLVLLRASNEHLLSVRVLRAREETKPPTRSLRPRCASTKGDRVATLVLSSAHLQQLHRLRMMAP
ncbi:MAG: hypothetical protein ACREIJ_08615, partial [Nitrospiraceae bacterium]